MLVGIVSLFKIEKSYTLLFYFIKVEKDAISFYLLSLRFAQFSLLGVNRMLSFVWSKIVSCVPLFASKKLNFDDSNVFIARTIFVEFSTLLFDLYDYF
jgi:hypothetical protein